MKKTSRSKWQQLEQAIKQKKQSPKPFKKLDANSQLYLDTVQPLQEEDINRYLLEMSRQLRTLSLIYISSKAYYTEWNDPDLNTKLKQYNSIKYNAALALDDLDWKAFEQQIEILEESNKFDQEQIYNCLLTKNKCIDLLNRFKANLQKFKNDTNLSVEKFSNNHIVTVNTLSMLLKRVEKPDSEIVLKPLITFIDEVNKLLKSKEPKVSKILSDLKQITAKICIEMAHRYYKIENLSGDASQLYFKAKELLNVQE